MKIFKFLVFMALLVPLVAQAQIGYDEYNKYWYYRHRLTTEFMVLGEGDHGCSSSTPVAYGYSLPAEYTYGGTNTGLLSADKMIRYADATCYLGQYIGVLATEHKLLKDAGWNTEQTDKELVWAMKAFERLEKYSSLWEYEEGNCYINGYFVRDDIYVTDPENSVFSENPVFERYKVGSSYNYISSYLESKSIPLSETKTVSNDQITHMFEGLALVKHCFEPSEAYNGYNFETRAINIAHRIADKLDNDRWYVKDDRGAHPELHNTLRKEGYGFLVAKSTGFITGINSRNYLNGISWITRKKIKDTAEASYYALIWGAIGDVGNDYVYTHITSSFAIGNPFDGKTENLLVKMDDEHDIGYYTFLYNFLRNKSVPIDNGKWQNELQSAPCFGITWRPANSLITSSHPYYNGNSGWRARNRWIRFNERWGKYEFPHYKGNGLDYMILYNLYLLNHKSKNPGLVGTLPYQPPGHYLKLDQPVSDLNYDLESYNTITLSGNVNFSNEDTRYITANEQVILKNGFSFKPQNGKTLIISSRGRVNACGHLLDEFGEPVGNPSVLKVAQNNPVKNDRSLEKSSSNNEEKYNTELKNDYVSLDEYLRDRNGGSLSAFVYPNPSKEKSSVALNLSTNQGQKVNFKMYDNSGTLIRDFGFFEVEESSMDLELPLGKSIKSGIYFIHVISGEDRKVLKQIIL